MKWWSLIITPIYAFLLIVLVFPLACICLQYEWWLPNFIGEWHFYEAGFYSEPLFWLTIALASLCQALLVDAFAGQADVLWRKFRFAIVQTFLLANLFYWLVLSASCLVMKDDIRKWLNSWEVLVREMAKNNLFRLIIGGSLDIDSSYYTVATHLILISIFWLVTGWFCYSRSQTADWGSLAPRMIDQLFWLAFIEFLCTLVLQFGFRRASYHHAAAISFIGASYGLALMLMCVSPGALSLFLPRSKQAIRMEPELKII